MPERENILAVDIGTSATKAVLFDGDGRILRLAREPYPVLTPQAGWAEQEPEAVHGAVLSAMRGAYRERPAGSRVGAVAFSAQWYSTLPVGADDRPLANSLTWADQRSAALADGLRRSAEGRRIVQATGCPLDAIYPLSKILWLRRAGLPGRPARFISIKEYVFRRLFGEYVVDWSMASSTGLFDIRTRRWSPLALEAAGIGEEHLSTPVSPRTIHTRWDPEALRATGIPQGTPCVIGAGDGVLASIGVGAVEPGVAAVNVGTSAACRYLVRRPIVDPEGRLWTYALDEDWWVIGGIVSSGGIVYDWFVREVAGAADAADPHAAVNALAAQVAPGAEGLLFLPYLGGEQCPVWDPRTTGAFVGLTLRHGRAHLARAVYEGIAMALARVIRALAAAVEPIREARITGGLIGSPAWLQLAADMWGARLRVPDSAEGSALGAAILAWVALRAAPDIRVAADLARSARVVEPDPARHAAYRGLLERAARVLEAIRSAGGSSVAG